MVEASRLRSTGDVATLAGGGADRRASMYCAAAIVLPQVPPRVARPAHDQMRTSATPQCREMARCGVLGWCSAGPGIDFPTCRSWGFRSAALVCRVAPLVLPD